jgi:hypothetical protein
MIELLSGVFILKQSTGKIIVHQVYAKIWTILRLTLFPVLCLRLKKQNSHLKLQYFQSDARIYTILMLELLFCAETL